MQVVRTVVWIVVTALLVAFVAMNWTKAPVNLWPLEQGYVYVNWPVGLIAIVFFLLGLLPMWLLHRAVRWQMSRRINTLQTSLAPPPVAPAPFAADPLSTADRR